MSLEKIERIRSHEKFIDSDIEAILITKPENIIYILGFKIESDVHILISKEDLKTLDGKILIFISALDYDQAKENIDGDKELSENVEIKQIPSGAVSFVNNTIKKLNLSCIGFEDDYVSFKKYSEWKEKFSNSNFIGISGIINDARIVKTQKEIGRMKKAAELGDIGFKTIFESIEEGMTEKELAAEAEYAMRKAGSDGTSFDTIIASGERSAYPHGKTSDKKIQDGDLTIVDIGSKYNGYCSDMTRTFIFGEVDPEKAKIVNLVNDGQQYALNNIEAGLKCQEIDNLVRLFFMNNNKELAPRFIHGLGHGVGIEIHENPYLTQPSQEVLKENMVVTVEPGLYVPGLGGARTEDLIVIKDTGFESLTNSKKFYY